MSKSEIIRAALEKAKGNLTYGDVKAEMEKASIDANTFNVTKAGWKKKQGGEQTKPASRKKKNKPDPVATVEPSLTDAAAFVKEAGSLQAAQARIAALKTTIAEQEALVSKFQEVVALAGTSA